MIIRICRDTETVRYAAEELTKYIRMMTDCDVMPEITAEESAAEDTITLGLLEDLLLDTSDLKDPFVEDILDIRVERGAGYIAGSNERSVLMAVYKYCHSAGCRFLRPGDGGDYVPLCDILSHSFVYRKKADQPFRGECSEGAISYEHMRDTVYWLPKVGMNMYMIEGLVPYTYMHKWYGHIGNRILRRKGQVTDYNELDGYIRRLEMDIKKTGVQLHTIGHGWMFEKLGVHHASPGEESRSLREEDKQYLAQVNGVRDLYHNSTFYTHFCYSNPAARKILVDFCVDYVKERPYVDFLHIWLADSANNQCECEECLKMTPSDHYVQLLNEIDEALAELNAKTRLVFILYVDTVRPPEKLRLKHPERFVLLAAIGAEYETGYKNHPFSGEIPPFVHNQFKAPSKALRLLWHRQWKELYGDVNSIIFEYRFYIDQYCDPGTMRIARETYRDMRALKDVSFQGCMNDQTHRMYLPTSLPLMLMGETLFDENLDFEAYCSDYFASAFGEDGAACRAYLETLSDLFCPANVRATGKNCVEDIGLDGTEANPKAWPGNAEVAEKAAKIPAVLDEFESVIHRNMSAHDACRRQSWVYLMYHSQICRRLAEVIRLGGLGDMEGAKAALDVLERYLARVEPDIHNAFDVFLFQRFMRAKMGLGQYKYYD